MHEHLKLTLPEPPTCPTCRKRLDLIFEGGCGGIYSIRGCRTCKYAEQQTTGGIVATPGGERTKPIEWNTAWDKEIP